MELTVSQKDVRKAQSVKKQLQRNVERLQDELGKKVYLTQANLWRITGKFREKTKAKIEFATTTTLQGWSEQAVELQVLRMDKANRELRGLGFWKLDKANCKAVKKKPNNELYADRPHTS
jgi:polyribonucleotide nucleotidyltransferase